MFNSPNMSPTRTTVNNPKSVVPASIKAPFAGDAILNLKLTTDVTGTVSESLSFPVPVFGVILRASDYQEIIKNVPTGFTLAVSESSNGLVFTYTNGANALAITVSSSTMNYKSLLQATLTNYMRFNTIRASVSPSTAADNQFAEKFETFQKSVFGGVKSNSIDVDVNKTPDQNQPNIVDIVTPITIDGERGIVVNINSGTSSYNLNCATSQYSKSTFNV